MNKKIDKTLSFSMLAIVFLFVLYPFIFLFLYGVDKSIVNILALDGNYYVKLIKNSISLVGITVVLTLIISLSLVIVYIFSSDKIKKVILAILSLGIISPPFVMSLAYIQLFGKRGFITYQVLGLNINPYGMWSVAFVQTLGYISLATLILVGFTTVITKDIINSAKSLGATTNSIIVNIIFPMLKPAIVTTILLVFVRSMADFGTATIVGGNYNVLATEGYLAIIAEGNLTKAITLNLIICSFALVVFSFCASSLKKVNLANGTEESSFSLKRKGLLLKVMYIISLFSLIGLISLYSSILLSAFTTRYEGKLVLTLENFVEASSYIDSSFIRTIIYSLVSAIIATIVAQLFQYYYVIRKRKFFKFFDFIILSPYILPGTFFGLGYLIAFSNDYSSLIGTSFIVIMNLTFKQLPLTNKLAQNSMIAINDDYLKSVRDLGGSFLDEIKDVVFPLNKNTLAISFINGFTASMTTLGSIIFLVSPGQKVITMVMFDAIETGNYDVASVIVFYIITTCLLVNVGAYFLIRRK